MSALTRERAAAAAAAPERAASLPTVHRALLLLAVGGLFGALLKAWPVIIAEPVTGMAIVVLTGAGLLLVCAVAGARADALPRLERWTLVFGLLVLAAWGAAELHASGGYATDEAAFLQGAADRLLHGHDPYGASLTGSLSTYAVPPAFWTYTTDGGMVGTLGYPALPVLLVVPFVQLTGGGQAVPIADLALLAAAVWAAFAVLPTPLRPLAILAGVGLPSLLDFALAGMTEIMLLATLIAACHRWGTIGTGGRLGRAGLAAGAALGLAVSTNQLAWFLTPYLLTGIFCARSPELGRRGAALVTARFAAVAGAVFVAVDLPFVVWDPSAWVHAVAAPLTDHSLPYGQGIVGLALYAGVGGGAMALFSIAGLLLFAAALVLFGCEFRRLRRALFALPLLALFLSGRSLAGYWIVLVPVVLVAALGAPEPAPAGATPAAPARRPVTGSCRCRRALLALAFAPAAACLAVALTTPAPLRLSVLGSRSGARFAVDWLRVAVSNTTGESLRPFYATNTRGQATAFWTVVRGPSVLAPGQRAIVELRQRDGASMPHNGTQFVVQAVTDSPRTVSVSGRTVGAGPAPQEW